MHEVTKYSARAVIYVYIPHCSACRIEGLYLRAGNNFQVYRNVSQVHDMRGRRDMLFVRSNSMLVS